MPAGLSENIYNFYNGILGNGREQIFTEAINYYTINQVGVNRHGGTPYFVVRQKI